jgi:hypothetical protein
VELSSERLKKTNFETVAVRAFFLWTEDEPPRQLPFTLKEVNSHSAPQGFEQFSLLFQGPAEPLLAQGTYRFEHAQLGVMPLFMVPVARSAQGVWYEVCVSRVTAEN